MTNRKTKPSKHLKLELTVKGMAGSKKLIGMLNRCGYCISYRTTEELKTELTFTVTSASKISPPDLVADSSLTAGIVYDIFDRFVESLSGKSTLHDTSGYCVPICIRGNIWSYSYRTRGSSFYKWWLNELKKEKNLQKFWRGYQALYEVKSWTDAAGMYRLTMDFRELPTGKSQRFIADD